MAYIAEATSQHETFQCTQCRIGRNHLVSFSSPGGKEGGTVERNVRVDLKRKAFVTGKEMLFSAYGNEGRREVQRGAVIDHLVVKRVESGVRGGVGAVKGVTHRHPNALTASHGLSVRGKSRFAERKSVSMEWCIR
jgi:hypothetical protein